MEELSPTRGEERDRPVAVAGSLGGVHLVCQVPSMRGAPAARSANPKMSRKPALGISGVWCCILEMWELQRKRPEALESLERRNVPTRLRTL